MYKIFGWQYFFQLFLCVGIVLALVFALLKLQNKARKIAQISLISTIGLFLILEYVGRIMIAGEFRFGDQLPLNTFQVLSYISIIALFTSKISWTKFTYLITTLVSAYNLIFVPEFYVQGNAFSLAVLSYVIVNAVLIANAILNMIWSEEELEKKDILDASLTYVIIVAAIHIFNVFLRFTAWGVHANYFGTMGEEYDILIKWIYSFLPSPFVLILPLLAILVGVQFLIVLPFDLIKTKRKRQSNIEELIALGNLKAQQEYREKQHKSKPKSQILVKGENKATPKEQKNITNKTKTGFVSTNKEIKVHKNTKQDN